MDYGITRLALGEQPFIEIDEARYKRVCAAKEHFIGALGIEEKFDLLLENYAELERELLQLNLRELVFRHQDWHGYRADSRQVSRRLANLLSSARLYIDQVQHDISSLLGSQALEQFKEKLSEAYDSSLSYRFMEALRNYVQHRGIPVKSVSYGSRWHREQEPPVHEFRAGFVLDTELLNEDPKFKPSVLEEFCDRGKKANVMGDVRAYVALLSEVQEWLRAEAAHQVEEWEAELRTVIDIGKREFPEGRIVGLGVVARADNGTYSEHEQVFEDLLMYRRFFVRKNVTMRLLAQRYVSSLGLPGGDA